MKKLIFALTTIIALSSLTSCSKAPKCVKCTLFNFSSTECEADFKGGSTLSWADYSAGLIKNNPNCVAADSK